MEKRFTGNLSKVKEEGRLPCDFEGTFLLLRGGWDGKGVSGDIDRTTSVAVGGLGERAPGRSQS